LLTFERIFVPEAYVIVIVAGISDGNTTLNTQFASIGRFNWKATLKLEGSLTTFEPLKRISLRF